MSKYRPTEFHYYDWDFNNWFGSETRANCRALPSSDMPMGLLANAAEGAYRNLLDYCYKQGDIPGDLGGMAALCGMSPEAFELVWPAFRNKFSAHKSKPNRLVHDKALARRRAWNNKRYQNSKAGTASALKRAMDKANGIIVMDNDRSPTVQRDFDSVHHEIGNRKKEIGNRKDAAAVAAEEPQQQNKPRYQPFEEVDLSLLARETVEALMREHPLPGNPHLAVTVLENILARAVEPLTVIASVKKHHALSVKFWDEERALNPRFFIPQLHRWFSDGDYMNPPKIREPTAINGRGNPMEQARELMRREKERGAGKST